uniref:Uncharacterized protein n=1 Tax=Setaria digitata TaxID=48799 RepID=A0A915PZ94_9BILA
MYRKKQSIPSGACCVSVVKDMGSETLKFEGRITILFFASYHGDAPIPLNASVPVLLYTAQMVHGVCRHNSKNAYLGRQGCSCTVFFEYLFEAGVKQKMGEVFTSTVWLRVDDKGDIRVNSISSSSSDGGNSSSISSSSRREDEKGECWMEEVEEASWVKKNEDWYSALYLSIWCCYGYYAIVLCLAPFPISMDKELLHQDDFTGKSMQRAPCARFANSDHVLGGCTGGMEELWMDHLHQTCILALALRMACSYAAVTGRIYHVSYSDRIECFAWFRHIVCKLWRRFVKSLGSSDAAV